jgi:hypothetical protein
MAKRHKQLKNPIENLSGTSKSILLAGLTIGGLSIITYVIIALRSWYFQDDFGFLLRYQIIGLSDFIPSEANFGRPLSRNLYWWILNKLFGTDATSYYFVNIFILLLNSKILFEWLRSIDFSHVGASVAAVIYISMLPTIVNITWLSNSQHLLAHTFTVLLLFFTVRSFPEEIYLKNVVIWAIVFIAGIASNIYVAATLGMILCYWIAFYRINFLTKKVAFYRLVFILSGSLILLLWSLKIISVFNGQYTNQYSISQISANSEYYFRALNIPLIMTPALVGISYGIFFRTRKTLFFLLSSLFFYLPFAFAKNQRYENYVAISYLFFLVAALAGLDRSQKNAESFDFIKRTASGCLMISIVAICYYQGSILRQFFLLHPRGAAEYELVKQIADTVVGDKNIICLEGSDKKEPIWWIFMGQGLAFNIYSPIDGAPRTYFLSGHPSCKKDKATHFKVYFENWRPVAAKID